MNVAAWRSAGRISRKKGAGTSKKRPLRAASRLRPPAAKEHSDSNSSAVQRLTTICTGSFRSSDRQVRITLSPTDNIVLFLVRRGLWIRRHFRRRAGRIAAAATTAETMTTVGTAGAVNRPAAGTTVGTTIRGGIGLSFRQVASSVFFDSKFGHGRGR